MNPDPALGESGLHLGSREGRILSLCNPPRNSDGSRHLFDDTMFILMTLAASAETAEVTVTYCRTMLPLASSDLCLICDSRFLIGTQRAFQMARQPENKNKRG